MQAIFGFQFFGLLGYIVWLVALGQSGGSFFFIPLFFRRCPQNDLAAPGSLVALAWDACGKKIKKNPVARQCRDPELRRRQLRHLLRVMPYGTQLWPI